MLDAGRRPDNLASQTMTEVRSGALSSWGSADVCCPVALEPASDNNPYLFKTGLTAPRRSVEISGLMASRALNVAGTF